MSIEGEGSTTADTEFLAFQMIAVSVRTAIIRLSEAEFAASVLVTSFLQYHALGGGLYCASATCQSVFNEYQRLGLEGVYSLNKEVKRGNFLASVGVFDFFLFDILRFVLLRHPEMIPQNPRIRRKPTESSSDFVRRILQETSQKVRLDFLISNLGVKLNEEVVVRWKKIVELRNIIAHHSTYYEYSEDPRTGGVWAEESPVPDVSLEGAMVARMLVMEMADAIFEAVCRKLFDREPDLRPLTPEVAEVNARLRADFAQQQLRGPEVEEYTEPEWEAKTREDFCWVGDKEDWFLISPTGIEVLPALITFRRNDVHGKKAQVRVDTQEPLELDNKDLITQILSGQNLLIEFYEEPHEGVRYARFSLAGFKEAWQQASLLQTRMRQD